LNIDLKQKVSLDVEAQTTTYHFNLATKHADSDFDAVIL